MTGEALDLLASLVLEDDRRWGEAATDWQWEDATAILDPASATPYHFLTRPRGGSKTSDLAGVSIAALLRQLPAHARAYAVAADRDQGRLLVDAVAGFVARTGIGHALRVDQWRVTALHSGATLEVLAADGPSAYGLKPHLVIVDELAQWPTTPNARNVWEAVVSAVPKVAGCRLVVLTSAGSPSHWSHKVREHARAQTRWRIHEVPGPCPWIAEDALAEQRALLTESQYARLHLNQWVAAEDSLVHPDDLAACVTLSGPQPYVSRHRYVVALDVGLKNDRTVAAVCHAEQPDPTRPRVALDRMQVWQGSRLKPVRLADVEEWVEQAARSYGRAEIVLDPWQAVGLAQRLRSRGVTVHEHAFTAQSVGRLASTLHRLLRDHALDLPDDEALLDELANVRLRETSPGVVRLDHDAGKHDDRAVALALAAQHLLAKPGPSPVRRGQLVRVGGRDDRAHYEAVFPDPESPEERKRVYHERWRASAAARHLRRDGQFDVHRLGPLSRGR